MNVKRPGEEGSPFEWSLLCSMGHRRRAVRTPPILGECGKCPTPKGDVGPSIARRVAAATLQWRARSPVEGRVV